jgi:hypothetical protein
VTDKTESGRDEHYPCGTSPHCQDYPWHAAFEAIRTTVEEEASALRALVRDPDSACPARLMRKERLAALEWVLNLHDELGRWDW